MLKRLQMKKNQKGFTLIELMIVVAIIGILAAIAIPNFLRYQLKSKTAEAKTNMGAIKTSQEAFKAERDYYATCAPNPIAGVNADGAKQGWDVNAGDGFSEIGFQPSSNVYYTYAVGIVGGPAPAAVGSLAANLMGVGYGLTASADLDTDTVQGEYGFSTDYNADGNVDVATVAPAGGTITTISTIEDLAPGQF